MCFINTPMTQAPFLKLNVNCWVGESKFISKMDYFLRKKNRWNLLAGTEKCDFSIEEEKYRTFLV